MVKTFTDQNFEKEVLQSSQLVLVDFWAPWCGPCQTITPIIEELSEELKDKVSIGKLNVDENSQTAQKYGVMSIPTVIIFKNGQVADQIIGLQPKETLKQKISSLI